MVWFLISLVNANCASFQTLFSDWNALTLEDLRLAHGDIEGRSFAGTTAYLQYFSVGKTLNYQCTSSSTISASKIDAFEGNFCGGAVEATTFEDMKKTGSNINCDWTNGRDCGVERIPLKTVCFSLLCMQSLIWSRRAPGRLCKRSSNI